MTMSSKNRVPGLRSNPGTLFFEATTGFEPVIKVLQTSATNPNEFWIIQQARQLVWELPVQDRSIGFLIHDNDTKFSKAFDTVFESEGIHVINTPFRAPNANGYASYCTSFELSGMNSESGKRRRSASF